MDASSLEVQEILFEGLEAKVPLADFRLRIMSSVERAATSLCPTRGSDCQVYNGLRQQLSQKASQQGDVRLHVIPVDPLSWMRDVDLNRGTKQAQSLAEEVNLHRNYIRFKGSDHVFVCLTGSCQKWAEAFAEMLSDNQGTRAIFAGIDIDVIGLQWPCPLRVINLDGSELEDMEQLVDNILEQASFMIERKNRWVCADKDNPKNHFGEHNATLSSGGVYMDEYGFLMCQIPKSGSTMLMMLLRKMMHREDWKSEEDGLPHNPVRSGVRYMNEENNFTLMKAIYDDPSIVTAAVVRHPIPRLLSGYLDKIRDETGYGRIAGLSEYVNDNGVPSFAEFVEFLIERHPDTYDPEFDPHFGIQASKCGLRDHKFDFVASLTELGSEFKEFSQSLEFWDPYVSSGWGKDGTQAFGERSYENRTHRSDNLVWEHYTEDLMHKVYDYYRDDFIRFGFTLEEIISTKPKDNQT